MLVEQPSILAGRTCSTRSFQYIATALKDLPDETVIDGELVALGQDGRPDFNLLQNFHSAESRIIYYAFDVLVHKGRRLTQLPLSERRAILSTVIEPSEHVGLSQVSDRSAAEMLKFVKGHGLEGVVAKRSDSLAARPANRALQQVSNQPRTGVRDWWLRTQPSWIVRADSPHREGGLLSGVRTATPESKLFRLQGQA